MKKITIAMMVFIATIYTAVFSASAQDKSVTHYTKTVQAEFVDVFADLQDAVINKGLVIDYVGNVDNMLNRTSSTAGSVTSDGEKSPYLNAKYMQFCSSKLTHKAVSADPHNLAICPYIVYMFETRAKPGNITIGYRPPIFGPSKRSRKIKVEVLEFLESIVNEAIAE